MRRHLLDLAILFVASSATTAGVAFAQPSLRSAAVHVYVLVLGALVMIALVDAAGDAGEADGGDTFDRSLLRPTPRRRPVAELEKLQREVTLATASAQDLHTRLLPQLREIAQARLERSGREAGPDTLGRWWELLRPDRPPPDDRFARGLSESELRALVADLGRM